MIIEQLLGLDDSDAKIEAVRELVSDLLLSSTFAPLRRTEPQAPSWISRSRWAAEAAAAALREWIQTSGLGWERTLDPVPGLSFEACFHPESATHRRVATALYLKALPGHCHRGELRLADFLGDEAPSWGEELAAHAASDAFLGSLVALDDEAQIAAAGSILGKLHWLAPHRVPSVGEIFQDRLPAYARAPWPPAASRDATGSLLPFCFEPSIVRAFLAPRLAEAIHGAMAWGDLDLLEYSWSASQSASLSLPQSSGLTLASFTEAIHRLSEAERALLTEALLKALPLLSRAIGPFVEVPLKNLHAATHPEGRVP